MIALLLSFRLQQRLLQGGNFSVLKFGHAGEISGAAGGLEFAPGGVEVFLDLGGAAPGRLLLGPTGVELGILAIEGGNLPLEGLKALPGGLVRLPGQGFPLDLQLNEAPLELVHDLRLGVDLHADTARRLIDEVDGLIRQLAIGYVAVGQLRRRHQRRIADRDSVVDLVALLQAAKDGDGVLHGGLIHLHLLEPALEGGILFDVVAVFIERGSAHAVELASGKGGLQHVPRVHGAVGLPSAHHGVELINEKNDLPLFLGQALKDAL